MVLGRHLGAAAKILCIELLSCVRSCWCGSASASLPEFLDYPRAFGGLQGPGNPVSLAIVEPVNWADCR